MEPTEEGFVREAYDVMKPRVELLRAWRSSEGEDWQKSIAELAALRDPPVARLPSLIARVKELLYSEFFYGKSRCDALPTATAHARLMPVSFSP